MAPSNIGESTIFCIIKYVCNDLLNISPKLLLIFRFFLIILIYSFGHLSKTNTLLFYIFNIYTHDCPWYCLSPLISLLHQNHSNFFLASINLWPQFYSVLFSDKVIRLYKNMGNSISHVRQYCGIVEKLTKVFTAAISNVTLIVRVCRMP